MSERKEPTAPSPVAQPEKPDRGEQLAGVSQRGEEFSEQTAESSAEDPLPRRLHPLPRGLVELYGLLAVLFVLVPEWMASNALFGLRDGLAGSQLPAPSGAWKRLPELRLASLNLAELRLMARDLGMVGYSRQNRNQLNARLLRRLKARL